MEWFSWQCRLSRQDDSRLKFVFAGPHSSKGDVYTSRNGCKGDKKSLFLSRFLVLSSVTPKSPSYSSHSSSNSC